MTIHFQAKSKVVPGLQFVADNMEFMSAAGRRYMQEVPMMVDRAEIYREQMTVSTLRNLVQNPDNAQSVIHLRHQLMQLHDIRTTLRNLQSHTVLDEVDLFEVKNLAYISSNARKVLDSMGVLSVFFVPQLDEVFASLDPDNTGLPNFYIYDSYDIRLAPIRREMKSADDVRMADLLAQQNEIQNQVLACLSDKLFGHSHELLTALDQMAYLDFAMAKAYLAIEWDLSLPCSEAGCHSFLGLFNPRLKQHNEQIGLRYQPIDIELTKGVTLITGANMAGKTVLLKSVGVAQLMYQFGFPIPATSCVMSPVEDVVFCIGDDQNEMNGLSSFAAEITRISDVVRRSQNERLLVLIDEPARTTNPIEGKALVQSIVSIMHLRDSITMITTHYGQLGVDCRRLRVKGFVESMVDVPLTALNINHFIDYSLVKDESDEVPQEALRIAEMLECEPELVSLAHDFLKQD